MVHVKSMINNLEIMPFKVAAYHKEHQKMEFVPDGKNSEFDFISGSRMRGMAKKNENLPPGFMS